MDSESPIEMRTAGSISDATTACTLSNPMGIIRSEFHPKWEFTDPMLSSLGVFGNSPAGRGHGHEYPDVTRYRCRPPTTASLGYGRPS